MPFRVSVLIDRPVKQVWEYFLDRTNWVHWHGGAMSEVVPRWQEGATIVWGNGQKTQIESFVPPSEVTTVSGGGRDTYRFVRTDASSTRVEHEYSPSAMMGHADWESYMQSKLDKMKMHITQGKGQPVSGQAAPSPASNDVPRREAQAAMASKPMHMVLEIIKGRDTGLQMTVPATGTVLGRAPDCGVPLQDPTVSRKHCRFAFEHGKWMVHDLGSRSGVIVNGNKTIACGLLPGDEIRLGDLYLKVLPSPSPQSVAPRIQQTPKPAQTEPTQVSTPPTPTALSCPRCASTDIRRPYRWRAFAIALCVLVLSAALGPRLLGGEFALAVITLCPLVFVISTFVGALRKRNRCRACGYKWKHGTRPSAAALTATALSPSDQDRGRPSGGEGIKPTGAKAAKVWVFVVAAVAAIVVLLIIVLFLAVKNQPRPMPPAPIAPRPTPSPTLKR